MRIDEFARYADGGVTASDRLRFATVGFDIQPAAAPVTAPLGSGPAAVWQHPQEPPKWPTTLIAQGMATLRLVGRGDVRTDQAVAGTAVGRVALSGTAAVSARGVQTTQANMVGDAAVALHAAQPGYFTAIGQGAVQQAQVMAGHLWMRGSPWIQPELVPVTARAPVWEPGGKLPQWRRDEEELLLMEEL